ncbi:MAG: efflux RND transporter periplasmic adaptor subunit [Chitinispirillales bacterium]|jgi:RND family efflux transporter MFP subunit|nr:efflux RND transporter periplasmic adaptor subunit [Chitinispirillales bacterium]
MKTVSQKKVSSIRALSVPVLLLVSILISIPMLPGCDKLQKEKETKDITSTPATAEIEMIYLPVRAAVAAKRDIIQALNFSGSIDAFRRAAIAPAVMGSRVMRIFVDEGSSVKEGQLLVRMEDFQLRQSAAQMSQLESDYKRMSALYSKGSVTAQQYEQVSSGFNAAVAGYELLKNSVELRAPFTGTVIGKYVNEGEVYTGTPGYDGISGVLSIAQLSRMKIEVMVPEQDFVLLHPGQPAQVKTDAYPGMDFEGKIFTVNPALNRMSRTSRVAVEIKNDKQMLKPGMFAKVEIVTNSLTNVLAVPATAVVMRNGEANVFIVDRQDQLPYETHPKLVKVKTGLVTDTYAQILEGINEGTIVLTDNNVSLVNGTNIRVMEIK